MDAEFIVIDYRAIGAVLAHIINFHLQGNEGKRRLKIGEVRGDVKISLPPEVNTR